MEIVNERIILDGTFFDIVCHISKDGTCYNYIRFKKHEQPTPERVNTYKQTYEDFLVSKARNTQNLEEYNENLKQQTLSVELAEEAIRIYYFLNHNDIVFEGKQDIQELHQENYYRKKDDFYRKKDDKKCFFHITKNNRSIGVFVIFDEKDNDKKYAIICNYTNKDDINEIKSKLRKNCTIINLPQVQNDNHSCSEVFR